MAGIYIVASGWLAVRWVHELEDLLLLEQIKGLGFVAVTGGLLFFLTRRTLDRIRAADDALHASREAFLRAERQASVGLLAASVAHDFKNHLMVLSGGVEELRSGLNLAHTTGWTPAPIRAGGVSESNANDLPTSEEILKEMAEVIETGSELASRLARVGRSNASARAEAVDLVALVEAAVARVRMHARVRRCEVRIRSPERCPMTAYPALIEQVIGNLVVNAADAGEGHGTIEVRVERGAERVLLEIHDDGPGMSETQRAQAGTAFFTTKEHGTGLGLVSVRICAEFHGGDLALEPSPLGGLCVRLTLPVEPPSPSVPSGQ